MTERRSFLRKSIPGLIASVAVVGAGCYSRSHESAPVLPAPAQTVSGPPASVMQQPPMTTTMLTEVTEPYIENLVLVDAPVRLVLQRLAELGKLDLVIPASINKTISVQYVHVPVSVALNDVLKRSGLRLGTATVGALPFDTVTVYYQLPANVETMSVEAIMTRFAVSRAMAELIVKSRPPR